MKKDKHKLKEMREEYHRDDFRKGVRGKYFNSYRKGKNLVLLAPDVAKAFPTEEAVNRALREIITPSRKSSRRIAIRTSARKLRNS